MGNIYSNFGKCIEKEFGNVESKNRYRDMIRKKDNVYSHLHLILNFRDKIINDGLEIDSADANCLSNHISDCLNNIYTSMEYAIQSIAGPFSQAYRGTHFPRSYNKHINDLREYFKIIDGYYKKNQPRNREERDKKEKIEREINSSSKFRDKKVNRYFKDTLEWYDPLHDIRSQDAHISMGNVEYRKAKLCYVNDNNRNRSSVFETDEIVIEVEKIIELINLYFISLSKLDDLIVYLLNKIRNIR